MQARFIEMNQVFATTKKVGYFTNRVVYIVKFLISKIDFMLF